MDKISRIEILHLIKNSDRIANALERIAKTMENQSQLPDWLPKYEDEQFKECCSCKHEFKLLTDFPCDICNDCSEWQQKEE